MAHETLCVAKFAAMIALKIAWRNLLAAKRRTLITVLLGGVSSALMILFWSMNEGSYKGMIKNSVEMYSGYVQVQGAGYYDDPGLEKLIFNADRVAEAIAQTPGIALSAQRFEMFALYASDRGAYGGLIAGVEPEKEARLSWVKKSLIDGEFLSESDENAVILGEVLARKLGVKTGDIISYISTATDYATAADNVIVKGIFKVGMNEFDGLYGFANKAYMDEIFYSQNTATAFVVLPENPGRSDTVAAALKDRLKDLEVEVLPWQKMNDELLRAIDLDRAFGGFMAAILFSVIFFVIMIYTLLAVHVRTREIGILRAIGTTPGGVFGMLFFEALLAGLLAAVLGMILGGGGAYWLQENPVPIQMLEEMQEGYGDMGYKIDPVLTALFSWAIIAKSATLIFALNLLAVLYPAWRVVRLKPIEAINHV